MTVRKPSPYLIRAEADAKFAIKCAPPPYAPATLSLGSGPTPGFLIRRKAMRFGNVILVCALGLALSACTYDPLWGVRTDEAIWARVERREEASPQAAAWVCVYERGQFTLDRRACLLLRDRMSRCIFVTLSGDRAHDRELYARCNGWRR